MKKCLRFYLKHFRGMTVLKLCLKIMSENFESVFGRRIVGAKGKEEGVKAKENLKEYFFKGEKEFTPYEIPKTERDKKIIEQAENSVDNLIRLAGGSPKPLGEKRIHFLKPGGVCALCEGRYSGAVCNPYRHSVEMDRTSSDVKTAIDLQHELLHLKGLTRAAIEKGIKREPIIRRSGIGINRIEKGKIISYLGKFEEGMISILNRLLFESDIKNNPLYQDELKMVEKIKPWISKVLEKKGGGYNEKQIKSRLADVYTVIGAKDVLEFLESERPDEEKLAHLWKITERSWKESPIEKRERIKRENPLEELEKQRDELKEKYTNLTSKLYLDPANKDYLHELSRIKEQIETAEKEIEKPEKEEPELEMAERTEEFGDLDKLFIEIAEKSGGEFDKGQILFEFAKAHFTGNLSPVRRMTERILGKGSWGKIMKKFSIEESKK